MSDAHSRAPWPGIQPERMLKGQRMVFPTKVKSRHQVWLSAWSECSMHGSPAHARPTPASTTRAWGHQASSH